MPDRVPLASFCDQPAVREFPQMFGNILEIAFDFIGDVEHRKIASTLKKKEDLHAPMICCSLE
jgi:hypothetical protein